MDFLTPLQLALVWAAAGLALAAAAWALRRWSVAAAARQRLAEFDAALVDERPLAASDEPGALGMWLVRAGYRDPDAAGWFIAAQLGFLGLGVVACGALYLLDVPGRMAAGLTALPGELVDTLLPVARLAPWIVLACLGSVPTLIVRAARRGRVRRIEQDTSLTLDLLATLSEAGLGFDAGLDRVLEAQSPDRPLVQEFRQFQVDVLAGRPRIAALRRLARRIDVSTISMFISAVVQAEQVGSGVAAVLRRQAEDLRQRRRETALAQAMAAPVKQLFPLVICFMPGLLVAALGPAMFQFLQFVEGWLATWNPAR